MKNKIKFFLLIAICFLSSLLITNAQELEIKSQNAILINLNENRILYSKNAQEQVPIASLTKIMTALITIENIENLEETVTITKEDFYGLKEANAATAGFRIGQKVTYRDLLYGLLLPSGADAAQALTRLVAGNQEKFVEKMNQKVEELKLKHTHFQNATGLDAENHYSTVEEFAQIFQYALQNEDLKSIITTEKYTISDGTFSVLSTLSKKKNTFQMDYLKGGKTGTTDNAGLCLASIASANGTDYLLVTVKAPQVKKEPHNFYDAKTIYEYYIQNYSNQYVIEEGEKILTLPTENAKESEIQFFANQTITKYLPNNYQKEDLKMEYQGKEIIPYNTSQNTKLGNLNIYYQEELISSFEIILNTKLNFDIWKYINTHKNILIFAGCILILAFLIIRKKKKRKKSRIVNFSKAKVREHQF